MLITLISFIIAMMLLLVFVRITERVSGWAIFLVLILSIIGCVFLFGSL